MCGFEKGIPPGFCAGAQWCENAVAQEHVGAQHNLGGLQEFRHGVKQEYV
jgi:hypothetical protein